MVQVWGTAYGASSYLPSITEGLLRHERNLAVKEHLKHNASFDFWCEYIQDNTSKGLILGKNNDGFLSDEEAEVEKQKYIKDCYNTYENLIIIDCKTLDF